MLMALLATSTDAIIGLTILPASQQ